MINTYTYLKNIFQVKYVTVPRNLVFTFQLTRYITTVSIYYTLKGLNSNKTIQYIF